MVLLVLLGLLALLDQAESQAQAVPPETVERLGVPGRPEWLAHLGVAVILELLAAAGIVGPREVAGIRGPAAHLETQEHQDQVGQPVLAVLQGLLGQAEQRAQVELRQQV